MNEARLRKAPFRLGDDDVAWAVRTYRSLTLKEKAGQLFLPLFLRGRGEGLEDLMRLAPAGLHRFPFESTEWLVETAERARRLSKVPPILSADLEFTQLGRLYPAGTEFTNQLGVAATREPERFARAMATIAAREGRALGFNLSFSPVLDIVGNIHNNLVINRSFGSDPALVARLGRAYVEAMQAEGMAACAKHWPGDGQDDRDQHMVTSCNHLSMDAWEASYGLAFRSAIDAGVLTVMASHINLPAYFEGREGEPGVRPYDPATISPGLTEGLLRERLCFGGVVISDATVIGGITSVIPRRDILPRVIAGGCDLALFAIDNEQDFCRLFSAVQEGVIGKERLEEAVLRVLGLKAALGLHRAPAEPLTLRAAEETLGAAEHRRWAEDCAEQAVTLVKDELGMLPLSPDRQRSVLLIQSEPRPILAEMLDGILIGDLLEAEGFRVTRFRSDTLVDPDLFDLVIYVLDQGSYLGIGDHRVPWTELHRDLYKGMIRFWHEIPTLMVSLNNPFHLYDAPDVPAYINAYSSTPLVQRRLVDMLVGRLPFLGGNPVDPYSGLRGRNLPPGYASDGERDRGVLKAILFDLDGVVTDTAEYHYRAWKRLADEEGLAFDSEANESLKGVSRRDSLEAILRRNGASWDEERLAGGMERKNGYYVELLSDITPIDILPGIIAFLDELKVAGIRTGIASASRNASTVLRSLGLSDRFDIVVDAATIARGKPDPEVFLRGATLLGLEPEDCAGIEDAEAGVRAIRAAGMFSVGIGPGGAAADWPLASTAELRLASLLAKRGRR